VHIPDSPISLTKEEQNMKDGLFGSAEPTPEKSIIRPEEFPELNNLLDPMENESPAEMFMHEIDEEPDFMMPV
jgi:hypothetical protein